MIGRVLAADFLKIRRTMVWFLVFLGPVGVIALQACNFGLRYDYLTQEYADNLWRGLIMNVQFLATPALLLGITILTSMIAGYEHQLNSWKQLLALPVSRSSVFLSKFLLNSLLLLLSCLALGVGTIILGGLLKFGWSFPLPEVLRLSFYPFLAGLPILALQLWLSVVMKNQAIPLTVGILGTVICLVGYRLPDWLFWKWPIQLVDPEKINQTIMAGIVTGAILLLWGLFDFTRRDVNG